MDAFYASIEQRDRPELRGKPVIVGAVSARGVVAAASYEARTYGVHSAMPGFQARALCPHAVFLPANIKKYARVSEQVHDVFEQFTPLIEPLALDEAFLDITGSVHLYEGAQPLAAALRQRVLEQTGLTISCGVAPNKLVAKIACALSKPDGLYCVASSEVRALLEPLPLRRLLGIGPVAERALRAAGFETLGDLGSANLAVLHTVVGDRAAALARLARGEDERPVEPDRAPKSLGEENTFEHDQRGGDAITQALTSHAHAVARRLRRNGLRGGTVTLKVRLASRHGSNPARLTRSTRPTRPTQELPAPRYPLLTRARSLTQPTDDAALIRRIALELWNSANIVEPVRLVGIAMSHLRAVNVADAQLDLFDTDATQRAAKLGPALDAIRSRFGEQAIQVGAKAPQKLSPTLRKKRGE
jgi:DNA polymerase-4